MYDMITMWLIVAGYLLHLTYSDCGTWTVDGNTLDLSCLSYLTIYANDTEAAPHHYLWSVCRNGIPNSNCGSSPVMVTQTIPGDVTACYVLGRWDQSIQPEYTDVNGGTWKFRYPNGADDCGNPARTWAPTFVCSPGTIASFGMVSETAGSCFYELEVKTQYACTGQNYSCPNVTNDCIWNANNDKYKLDLTALRNKTFAKMDDVNNELMYILSPCRNHIQCNGGYVMSTITNVNVINIYQHGVSINYLECNQYLSLWNRGIVKPTYNPEQQQWKFVYNNGKPCNGKQNTFEVFWNCDYNIKNNAELINFKDVGGCSYQMYLNSSYACQ